LLNPKRMKRTPEQQKRPMVCPEFHQ
jgi:hypothetical protein